jgi:formylglycine-generating enzyme required for sulfatase activity
LTAGDREVVVSLPGYNPFSRQIRVVADEPQVLPEVVLTLADARVALGSTPADASVSLNGEYIGRTPFDLRLNPNTAHSLRLSKPGYESKTLDLRLNPGERESINVDLTELRGVVEVTSTPAGAEVLINGEPAGSTPLEIELMAVEQNVLVRLDGYAESSQSITPRPGYSQRLPFALEPLDDETGGGYPRIVTTSRGTNLRLIPAGQIQMGASRADSFALAREKARYRLVEVSRAFYLAETEMTNAEFRRCQPEHDSGTFEGMTLNDDDQPVVRVTVQEISACLNQLSIEDGLQPVYRERNGILVPQIERNGYRLPSEAEFALALRVAGRADEPPLRFSWGETLPPPDRVDNIADLSASDILETTLVTYTDGFPVSAPVGSFAANAAGLFDMGGNVAEWVQDFYDPLETFSDELIVDPRGPETGRSNIVRGPNWKSATTRRLQLSYLEYEDSPREDIGFRIARNLD